MNDDWRTRNTMPKGDIIKAAAVILGLLLACILFFWLLTRSRREALPTEPARPPAAQPKPVPTPRKSQ